MNTHIGIADPSIFLSKQVLKRYKTGLYVLVTSIGKKVLVTVICSHLDTALNVKVISVDFELLLLAFLKVTSSNLSRVCRT